MSKIDKRALREATEKALSVGDGKWRAWREAGIDPEIFTSSGHIVAKVNGSFSVARSDFIAAANPATVLALLDELEAKDSTIATQQQEIRTLLNALEAAGKRIAELNEALKQAVSGYKSCLRTGYERILELGGDCDSPEAMIAGNPDIQHAEKLIAAAAGKGE